VALPDSVERDDVDGAPQSLLHELERLLPKVVRPARYTGNEWNSIVKEWPGKLHVALAYPDVYEEGVGHPLVLAIYDALNRADDILCERAFLPWPDMEQALRAAGLRLYTLESKRPLTDFDIILVALPRELYAPSLLTLIDLAGLPLYAGQDSQAASGNVDGGRGQALSTPVVVGIGPGTANPEPLAAFFDAFIIGDVDATIVRQAAEITRCGERPLPAGLYLPRLYSISYAQDGTIASIGGDIPVTAYWRGEPAPSVTRPIVPFVETRHEWGIVELAHPPAYPWLDEAWPERPVEDILADVEAILSSTGYDHIQLAGRHSRLAEIVDRLSARYRGMHLHFSLETAGSNARLVDIADLLPRLTRGMLTFDMDAGDHDDIVAAAQLAFRRGWHIVKLTTSPGRPDRPTVTDIVTLARRVMDVGRAEVDGRAQVHVVATPFIPRPHSPWQRTGMVVGQEWERWVDTLSKGMRGPGLRLQWQGLTTRLVEAALARGDRRLGQVIATAWRSGMHHPDQCQDSTAWQAAFDAAGLDIAFYAVRERPDNEILPWQHISIVSRR